MIGRWEAIVYRWAHPLVLWQLMASLRSMCVCGHSFSLVCHGFQVLNCSWRKVVITCNNRLHYGRGYEGWLQCNLVTPTRRPSSWLVTVKRIKPSRRLSICVCFALRSNCKQRCCSWVSNKRIHSRAKGVCCRVPCIVIFRIHRWGSFLLSFPPWTSRCWFS